MLPVLLHLDDSVDAIMNVRQPQADRDYIPIADHGLSVMSTSV